MPQAIQMEICPWLFGTFRGTAPCVFRHHVMPIAYGRLVIGSVFPAEVIMFIEMMFVHWISIMRISLLCQTISQMQTMSFKECKAYVCLEVLKMQFFLVK